MSREEAVHSVMAQIYVLDSATQNWAPATFSVVNVTFYYDPATTRTRIIGMENNEAKVNSMILPGMSFMKPSETFGQWLDLTTNQLFGLNFTSVADTNQFDATFKAAVEGKRPGPATVDSAKTIVAGAAPLNKTAATAAGSSLSLKGASHSNESEALSKQVVDLTKRLQQKESELQQRTSERDALVAAASKADSLSGQLRSVQAENEALRTQMKTLAEQVNKSSANAGLEQQLKSAKDDISRLKAALLQNSTNASLWKEQLSKVEDDNKQLQDKVKKLEDIQRTFASVLSSK